MSQYKSLNQLGLTSQQQQALKYGDVNPNPVQTTKVPVTFGGYSYQNALGYLQPFINTNNKTSSYVDIQTAYSTCNSR